MVSARSTVGVTIATIAASALRCCAQCTYEVIALPNPCPNGSSGVIMDMNDDEVVVGFYTSCSAAVWRPWKWSAATGLVTLPLPQLPGAGDVVARRVAPDGTIVGTVELGSGAHKALVIWATDGSVSTAWPGGDNIDTNECVKRGDGTILGELQGGLGGFNPFAWFEGNPAPLPDQLTASHGGILDVAPNGLATGRWFLQSYAIDALPFIWDGNDSVILLPTPLPYEKAEGRRIDAFGRVAGTANTPGKNAFYWEAGAYTFLGGLPGDPFSSCTDSNVLGQIVGQSKSTLGDGGIPFLWQHGSIVAIESLGTFPFLDLPISVGAINNDGLIAARGMAHAYLLRPLGVVPADVDLNCRVDAEDLKLLFACWGPAGASPVKRADVNGDGSVDAYDLAEVLGAWTPVETTDRGRRK